MIPSSDCYEHTMLGSLCRLLELDHQCPRRFQGPRRFQETWFLTDEANGTNTLNSFPLENIYTWLPPGLEILRLMAILSEVRLQRSPEPSRAYKPGLMAKSLPWSGIFCYLESWGILILGYEGPMASCSFPSMMLCTSTQRDGEPMHVLPCPGFLLSSWETILALQGCPGACSSKSYVRHNGMIHCSQTLLYDTC